MKHLQAAVEATGGEVAAPQEVIDAIVTLTRAGLLNWLGSICTAVAFVQEPNYLNHKFLVCEKHDEMTDTYHYINEGNEGYLMTVTPDQIAQIQNAINAEKQDLEVLKATAGK